MKGFNETVETLLCKVNRSLLLKGAVTWDRLLIAGDLQCEISDLNFAL